MKSKLCQSHWEWNHYKCNESNCKCDCHESSSDYKKLISWLKNKIRPTKIINGEGN